MAESYVGVTVMRGPLLKWLRKRAHRSELARNTYKKLAKPDGCTWAQILKEAGLFYRMGERCSIQTNVTITDPALVSMGSNVRMSGCTLFGHDGSVNMLNAAYGVKLDAVGPIKLGDDVFIGHGAILLPGVSVGSRVIIASGALVSGNVPDNSLVAGVPARRIRSMDEHLAIVQERNEAYPWRDLIDQRKGGFDPEMEPELRRQRIEYFFGDKSAQSREYLRRKLETHPQ